MLLWCPDVPAVADTDIRTSLSDSDVIDLAEVGSPQQPAGVLN